jgi:xanthine dehydrogenase YagT iron-sulfur-binding subunit
MSSTPEAAATPPPASRCRVALTVNGRAVDADVPPCTTLAGLLRERLGLTGTKVACDEAACGACTVLLDGSAVFACHTLALQARGGSVVTIEGLADGPAPHALQQAFVDHDALQCGFCTPGMLMALKAALDDGVAADRAAIAQAISGNLCRCGAYEQILDAAVEVAARPTRHA